MPDDSYENRPSNGNGHAAAGTAALSPAAASNVLVGFQQTMSQWLDLQKGQLWMTGRFLDMQENLIRSANGLELLSAAPSNGMLMNGAVIDAPPVVHHQAPVGLAVAPAPMLPPLVVSQPTSAVSPAEQMRGVVGSQHDVAVAVPKATNGAPQPVAATNGASSPIKAEAKLSEPTNGSEAPPVERFRKDLLDAVSQRTGYPIDMLDENAALEAELGIDSIKTVEIFSSLTAYHAFLPGGDENQEETLATFSRMKTLRDIISVYSQRRNGSANDNGTVQANGHELAKPVAAANGQSNGHSTSGPPVERFTVETAFASDNSGSSKKKTSPGTISS